jgi:hypothetical protein
MSKSILLAAMLLSSSLANAQTVKLRGKAAELFVAKYFPNAEAPGAGRRSPAERRGRGRFAIEGKQTG